MGGACEFVGGDFDGSASVRYDNILLRYHPVYVNLLINNINDN